MSRGDARPKVLIVGHAPSAPGGIAAVVRLMLAPEMRSRYRMRVAATARRNTTHQARWGRVARSAGSAAGLLAALLCWRPDIVHLHSASYSSFWSIARAARLCRSVSRAKLVWHLHGGDFDAFIDGLSAEDRARVVQTLQRLDAAIGLTERWADVLRSVAGSTPVAIVRNASNHPCGRAERPPVPPLRVLYVGYLSRDKGVPELLRAAALLEGTGEEGYEYRLIGEPHTEEEGAEARRLAEESGASITFTGQRPAEALPAEYGAAHVLVLPSHWECVPMVLLEALAAGLPIITTPVGGITETLGPENALLVEPGDAEGLAEAIRCLRHDPVRRQDMGARNLGLFQERYTVERYARELDELYRRLLGSGGGDERA